MITVKEASERAASYMRDLLGVNEGVRLEEVELTGNHNLWRVTLSFQGDYAFKREYKDFVIDGDSGEVRSMKNRTVN